MLSQFVSASSEGPPLTYQDLFKPESPGSAYRTLSFPDVEWLTDGGGDLHLRPLWKAGLVPFALNGRGDAWCFKPEGHERPSVVALCCHDYSFGQIYAPSFSGWLFRRMLDVCRGDYGLEEARLEQWIDVLCPLLPLPWVQVLEALSGRSVTATLEKGRLRRALLSENEYQVMVGRYLNMPDLDLVFEWRRPEDSAQAVVS